MQNFYPDGPWWCPYSERKNWPRLLRIWGKWGRFWGWDAPGALAKLYGHSKIGRGDQLRDLCCTREKYHWKKSQKSVNAKTGISLVSLSRVCRVDHGSLFSGPDPTRYVGDPTRPAFITHKIHKWSRCYNRSQITSNVTVVTVVWLRSFVFL